MNRFLMICSAMGLLALSTGCPEDFRYEVPTYQGDDDTSEPEGPFDVDGDGYDSMDDCDDNDASIHPDADELCDGIDNDCDGDIDEDAIDGLLWYPDADSDGYGDDSVDPIVSCDEIEGYVTITGDCNDDAVTVHPGAPELCDNLDNDCNGEVDDGQDWWLDHDYDGYGDPDFYYVDGCDGSTYLVANDQDCNDNDPDINPGASELCDNIDQDCDGEVDEDAMDAPFWYPDIDHDGYAADTDDFVTACEQPDGYTAEIGDCDDTNWMISPAATEICNEVDDDCDGLTDEDVQTAYFVDVDGDGYGNPEFVELACDEAPDGYVLDNTDCDDSEPTAFPGNTEVCDGIDNDCDGDADTDAVDKTEYFEDNDGDGFGNEVYVELACEQPTGFVLDATDCDDSEPSTNPGASEYCDGVDNDCDGVVDPSTSLGVIDWFQDGDNDGYGNATGTPVTQCNQPAGYVADFADCDDSEPSTNPGASEVCDSVDNDCDGTVDESDALDASTWYADSDGDGHGDADFTMVACEAPSGYVADFTDCDDENPDMYYGNTEVCDGLDNDCDGEIDQGALDASTWYADSDGDGYGNVSYPPVYACEQPTGFVLDNTDCDDGSSDINPGASEYCDSVDNDCDGTVDESDALDASIWFEDGDNDDFGSADTSMMACSQPSGYADNNTDCDDGSADISPGASEYCDGVDNDCDGDTDEDDAVDAPTWYLDEDEDGYGNPAFFQVSCEAPSTYVDNAGDCDDNDNDNHEGAIEVCEDGEDNDCDGDIDELDECEPDEDGDGFVESQDCDDTDEYTNPNGVEVCDDGIDNDCDGLTDSDDYCLFEGTYEGPIGITLTETLYGLGSDTCEGTVTLVVDVTADPVISGTGECSFVGPFAYVFPDTYTANVLGAFADADLDSEGTVDVTDFGWTFEWATTWTAETELDIYFSGSDSYLGFNFDYDGYAETDLQ